MSDDPLFAASTLFNSLAIAISELDPHRNWNREDTLLPSAFSALRSFLSARTTAITILLAERAVWDADILLRSANECSMKASYIFLDQNCDEATLLAREYFGPLERAYKKRDASRANAAASVIERYDQFLGSEIMKEAADELNAHASELTKKERREIEQRWSYVSMLNSVLSRDALTNVQERASSLLHSFGFQSHLIHCNPAAIGLAEDANARSAAEGQLKDRGHAARVYYELTGAWLLFFLILRQHFEISESSHRKILDLSERLQTELSTVQSQFFNYLDTPET